MDCQQTHDSQTNYGQVFVYFPICPSSESDLVYGAVKPNENYYNCVNVYCTSFQKNKKLDLLGTWNCVEPKPSKQSKVWIQFTTDNKLCTKVESVFIDDVKIPLSRVVLILYDDTFLQSQIMQFNDDWTSSKCLSELCSLLRRKHCGDVPKRGQPHGKLTDSILNNSRVVQQLRQRVLQWKTWRNVQQCEMAYYNLLLMMLLDLFLGFCFVKLFHSLGGPNQVLEIFLDSVKVSVWLICSVYKLYLHMSVLLLGSGDCWWSPVTYWKSNGIPCWSETQQAIVNSPWQVLPLSSLFVEDLYR